MTMRLADAAATHALGTRLAQVVRAGDTIALSGPLGAGKTSIARGVLAGLGLAGEAPSPSFAIVQPYAPPQVRLPVLHVDLYRIADPDEVEELGLDDGAGEMLRVIEWPERVSRDWWPNALWLEIAMDGNARRLTAQVPAAWTQRWPLS